MEYISFYQGRIVPTCISLGRSPFPVIIRRPFNLKSLQDVTVIGVFGRPENGRYITM
jgi:hypothetical protein